MALPDTIRDQDYTALVWADTTDYSSTVSGLVRTHQIDLTGVADTEAREGAKADLTATRGPNFMVFVGIEADVAPTAGELIEIYWAESPHATAGNANPGGTSGTDADYTGTAGDTLANSIKQLIYVGSLICTVDLATTVQYQKIGVLSNILRYGMPVLKNESGQALEGDAVTMFIALLPLEKVVTD